MKKYTKIETLHARSEEGKHELLTNVYRDKTVEFIKDLEWIGTEKVDGTNIGIVWDGHSVSFQGRTENSDIPVRLLAALNTKFATPIMEEMFEQKFGEKPIILFGEGYGVGIQKVGKDYLPDKNDFILFDAYSPISECWLDRDSLEDIAKSLDIKIVPIVFRGTLAEGCEFIKTNPKSTLGNCVMEGIVCKPRVELLSRTGKRMIVKIKVCDYGNSN